MNQVRDLFRRTSLLFVKFPVLWLPLVLADTLRTLLQYFAQPLTRGALLAAAPRSTITGGIAGPPPQWKVELIVGGIGFAAVALGLLLLLYALGVVARAVRPERSIDRQQPELHFEIPVGLGSAWVQIAGLALLFFVFLGEFVNAVVVPRAVRAHMAASHVQWVIFAVTAPAFLLVLYLAVGPLRRYVLRVQAAAHTAASRSTHGEARLPYFLLLGAAAVCSNLASLGIALLLQRRLGAVRFAPSLTLLLLQVMTSVATALPYAYAMSGFSLSPRTADED